LKQKNTRGQKDTEHARRFTCVISKSWRPWAAQVGDPP
jgi:hypothetical protein